MISVCIPIIRPEKAKRVIDAIRNEGVECTHFGDHWPQIMIDYKQGLCVEIISELDRERIGCPKMLKQMVDKSTGDMVMFLGDDIIPQPGFIVNALTAMEKLSDGWGVVGLNSQPNKIASHFLADKRMLPFLGGEFFHTGYKHCFGDNELTDIAKEHDRFIFCDEATVEHDHPILSKESADNDYQRVYSREYWKHDKALYIKRKRGRLKDKIGIGFPLVDATLRVNFFTSFTCMEKPREYTFLVPEWPHGEFPETLAEARNSIVQQAQFDGCRHLFMMDTDQVYPSDTLTKLMKHKKDICGVLVHKRYIPFDPVCLRIDKNNGHYYRVPDEEIYSGNLIEVEATGTGALLLNMEIFDRIEEPWFKVQIDESGRTGEDIYFCGKAREAGVRIFVDTSIEVDHLATIAINKSVYQFLKLLYKKGG